MMMIGGEMNWPQAGNGAPKANSASPAANRTLVFMDPFLEAAVCWRSFCQTPKTEPNELTGGFLYFGRKGAAWPNLPVLSLLCGRLQRSEASYGWPVHSSSQSSFRPSP